VNRERIIALLGDDWRKTRDLLCDFLKSEVDLLNKTNAYVLENSGKMLRPMLCLLMARTCGKTTRVTYHFAAACEMLHNATLLHDDVADESVQRRGRPTVSSLLGPSSAVLLGDFWLSRSVDALLSEDCPYNVMRLFSDTLKNLSEGEMLQLQKAGTADTDEKDYFRIIFGKTASLFEVAGMSGAISSSAPDDYVEAAGEYSRNLGIAFQIRDDILDYSGDASLGKPIGVDLKEKKITLPLLCAMKGSSEEKRIRELVLDVDSKAENERLVRDFVKEREGEKKAAVILEEYVRKAVGALERFPESEERECLREIAEYNIIRTI